MNYHADANSVEDISPALELDKQTEESSLSKHKKKPVIPVIFLEEGVLFPGNVVPVTARDGLREKDMDLAKNGKLRIGVIGRGKGDCFNLDIDGSDSKAANVGTEAIVVGFMKVTSTGMQ